LVTTAVQMRYQFLWDAALCDWCSIFEDTITVLYSRVKMSMNKDSSDTLQTQNRRSQCSPKT